MQPNYSINKIILIFLLLFCPGRIRKRVQNQEKARTLTHILFDKSIRREIFRWHRPQTSPGPNRLFSADPLRVSHLIAQESFKLHLINIFFRLA